MIGWPRGWRCTWKASRVPKRAIARWRMSGPRTGAPCPRGCRKRAKVGMDQTRTWARTYWGGALLSAWRRMCGSRAHGKSHRTGRTALRAILEETGGYAAERPIREVWGFLATKPPERRVLEDLYEEYRAAAPRAPDLALLVAPASECRSPADSAVRRLIRRSRAIPIAITAPPAAATAPSCEDHIRRC